MLFTDVLQDLRRRRKKVSPSVNWSRARERVQESRFVFTTLVCASFTAVRLINRCHNGGRAIKRKTTHFKHTTFDV